MPTTLAPAVLHRRRVLRLGAAGMLGSAAVMAAVPAGAVTAGEARRVLVPTAVRSSANAAAPVRFRLAAGTRVSLTGYRNGAWVGVRHRLGLGFVLESVLGPDPVDGMRMQAAEVLFVRSGAGDAHPWRFLVGRGRAVSLTGRVNGAWYGVRHALGVGWVKAAALALPGATLPAVHTTQRLRVAASAWVRWSASATAAVRFRLEAGAVVGLMGDARGTWVNVRHAQGAGWMPAAALAAGPAPTSAQVAEPAVPVTVRGRSHTADGRTYGYHVVADGIDWSKPVGMAVYLEGDYWYAKDSVYLTPTGARAVALAAEANRRNMVLVVPQTPRPRREGYGYLWWWDTERQGNNVWLSSLLSTLYRAHPMLDRSRHWFLGYSGGAEFLTFEFFARAPENTVTGGGAVMVAGGGVEDAGKTRFYAMPPAAFRQSVRLEWFVGDRDGVGATWPATWSALQATALGEQAYRQAGFTRTARTVLPGVDHSGYDLAALLGRGLEKAGIRRLR
ncbi:hypothetical protein [Micrococcus sp.]|uniref:hypothetical protein n=1 Tax=Micrococcus sp. TaxID=1271 RepID=UPI002A917860|nr:hypothetical protein [Micrococcus sp.]MDY6055605.1 hypothetical protein [Micrococcus sp.]